MLTSLQRWFSVDTILPMKDRLGPVDTTKNLYNKYLKIAWPATLQGLMMQLMTAIDLAMVGSLGASALASVGIMGQPEMVMLVICRALSIAGDAHRASHVESFGHLLPYPCPDCARFVPISARRSAPWGMAERTDQYRSIRNMQRYLTLRLKGRQAVRAASCAGNGR